MRHHLYHQRDDMKGRLIKAFIAALICSWSVRAWSHGVDSSSIPQPRSEQASPTDAAFLRQEEQAKLPKNIDMLDERLEAPKLSAKKRAKLEKKPQKLLKQKSELPDTASRKW